MDKLTRRSLLQGLSGFAAATALSSCGKIVRIPDLTEDAIATERVVEPGALEKPNLTIGFVPVNDCAPFAVAYTKGFFWKYGLNVTLKREASWSMARDRVISGELDAAPVVSGDVINAWIGAKATHQAPLCAAMTIHRHGNAITMSKAMWNAGIRPLQEYNGDLKTFGQDVRRYLEHLPSQQRLWAIAPGSTIYNYFVRYLSAAAGVNPLEEFQTITISPSKMVSKMRNDSIQAYMMAEPWNTRAISGNEGVGFTFAQGQEIWQGHPDRVLTVMESFINDYPQTYCALVKAMIEACQYCSNPLNREEVVNIISSRLFTKAKRAYTRPAIAGKYDYGGFDAQLRVVRSDATVFFNLPSDLPHPPGDHSTFLWQSHGLWLMTQAARWGQIREIPADAEQKIRQAWRTDLYRTITAEMGIDCPQNDYKVEPASVFVDRRSFDPSNPVDYLNSFEIRARRPTRVFLA